MKRILFLCTGNYYRSRFAEILFNALAFPAGLEWRADSRGFCQHDENVGPISNYALGALAARGIPVRTDCRYPRVVCRDDLTGADRVIAMKEVEHRPLLDRMFPGYSDRVEFWHIDDLDKAGPTEALGNLEREVQRLIDRLRAESGAP